MIDEAMVQQHVGREETRRDFVDPERLQRLCALLDRPWSAQDAMPSLGHFLLFRPDERQSLIGQDGHPVRDPEGMLPAVSLARRMWAGSRIRFLSPVTPGTAVVRRSRLTSAAPKSGKTGHMLFCTVDHEIRDESTGELLIAEEQDIVYREGHQGQDAAPRPVIEPKFTPSHSSTLRVDPVMLFRYSALTFNAHRIHYDREYARHIEGYQGLVVHGPFLATMLFDHLVRSAPGRPIAEFGFRAMAPSFDGEDLTFGALVEGNEASLSVTGPVGLAMTGQARLHNG
jgi:3-methylfumaryl-CoA hydratase